MNTNYHYIIELTSYRNPRPRYLRAHRKGGKHNHATSTINERLITTRYPLTARKFAGQEEALEYVRENAAKFMLTFNVKRIDEVIS